MNPVFMEAWNPYFVGFGIGLLSLTSFLVSKRPLGVSTAFVELSGLIKNIFSSEKERETSYYRIHPPGFGWEFYLLLGVFGGGLISSVFSGKFVLEAVSEFWSLQFGDSIWIRQVAAFTGGLFLGFGSRMAGGCVSGHGLSGTVQNSVSSWITLFAIFFGAVASSFILYGVF